jgi:hypothetical protein
VDSSEGGGEGMKNRRKKNNRLLAYQAEEVLRKLSLKRSLNIGATKFLLPSFGTRK